MLLTLSLLACTGQLPEEEKKGLKPEDRPPLGDSASGDTDADADADADGDADADADSDADTDPVASMCQRWNAARKNMAEASWSGSVAGCDPGDLDAAGRARALELLNTYRLIAGQPEVDDDASKNATSQECALMMTANNELNHYPPTSWTCYTANGASGAGSSNIASGPAVMAMDMYMQDWGNETTIGHRRWILSNQLGPIGIGSTTNYSCLNVIYGSGSSARQWVAWPPDGAFPFEAVSAGGYTTLDQNGWTVQSDSINVNNATVTVTEDGVEKQVTTSSLLGGYGSTYAIKITPKNWTSKRGSTYHVALTDISKTIEYDVEMVDCNAY